MNDENKNKSWWNKLLGLHQIYKLNKPIFILFFTLILIFLINNNFALYKETEIEQFQAKITQVTKSGFEKTEKMRNKHVRHKSILLPNEKVLIYDSKAPEIFDPKSNSYKKLEYSQLKVSAEKINLSLMADEKVLIIADISRFVPHIELFDYKTETFEKFSPKLPYKLETSDTIKRIKVIPISSNLILFIFNNEYYIYDYLSGSYKNVDWNYNELGNINYFGQLFTDDNNNIFLRTFFKSSTKIIKYDILKNKFILLKTVNIPTSYCIKDNDIIYFFTGSVSYDNQKRRIEKLSSPIYWYDIKKNEFIQKGYLYGAGTEGAILLKDGSIMLKAGKFDQYNNIQYEIYHPNTNESSFTSSIKWHKDSSIILLNDGSILFSGRYIYSSDWINGTNHSFRYYPKSSFTTKKIK